MTLSSVMPQAAEAGAEVLVVTDEGNGATAAVAQRHRARLISLATPAGANAKRNAGVSAADGQLVIFIDDDVQAPAGWLNVFISSAASCPERAVFGGPIRAAIEGGGPRACGREAAITTLDLGPRDRDVQFVWTANMAIRRDALELTGPFDEMLLGTGEEEDWQRRYSAGGGSVRYLAQAGLEHRRVGADAKLHSLARAAYGRGRTARRYDVRKGTAPPILSELRTLAGCAWHTVRRRCAIGIVLGAHTAGRLREALADRDS